MTEEKILAEARKIVREVGGETIQENLNNEEFFITRTLNNGDTITLLFLGDGCRAIFRERYCFSQMDPNELIINFKWRR